MPALPEPSPPVSASARVRLANGLTLYLHSQPWLSQAALCVRVNGGSHDEPRAYPGLAHFLEHLLFLDCAAFSAEQRLMPFVQACGGQVNATTQARHSEYFCQVPVSQLGPALARLLAMLAQPLLTVQEQQREREVLHAEFLARGQDAETLLLTALGQALPSAHRGADFVAGNRHSLPIEQAEFQQALRDFHQRHYVAANCQLSVLGPQPLEQLQQIAEQYASQLPALAPPRKALTTSPAMLPLRFNQARIELPAGGQGLHLAWLLNLAQAEAEAALLWLNTWLLAPGPGGLAVGVEAKLRSVYSHQGQQIWLLSLSSSVAAEPLQARLASWATFMAARGDLSELLQQYQRARVYQLASLSPLALARLNALTLSGQAQPCTEATVQQLLSQLQQPERQLLLRQQGSVPPWPGAVFPLRLAPEPAALLAPLQLRWPAHSSNPLLSHTPLPTLPCAARFTWRDAPAREQLRPLPQAAWYGCCRFSQALSGSALQALAQACCAELIQHSAQLGVSVQFEAQAGVLLLRVQGAPALLLRVLSGVFSALAQPCAAHWQALQQAPLISAMPLRHLLNHCTQLFEQGPVAPLEPAAWPGLFAQMRIEALGVGFTAEAQAHIRQLFAAAHDDLAAPPISTKPGLHWQQLAVAGEAAVLLFCPQPSAGAENEAAWRLLAQLQQNAFYQRMRSELQLGYAVFCQYRQIQSQRGLLFAIQSPQLNAAELLQQIQLFLNERQQYLAQLSATELDSARASLNEQWQEQSTALASLAEQHWQAQLAGLRPEHTAQVQQHINTLSLNALLAAQQCLSQAQAGWLVLSNQAPSAEF